jgi:hypothetical protein
MESAALALAVATAGSLFGVTYQIGHCHPARRRPSTDQVREHAGPIVLAVRRLQHGRRLWLSSGEKLWGFLGLLWIATGLARSLRAVDPVTMTNLSSNAAALAAGFAPLLLVLVWYLERSRRRPGGPYSWCHHVGILCTAAWPAGWTLAAFLLGA